MKGCTTGASNEATSQLMATETVVNDDENEIKQIIDQLFHHRKAKEVKEADQLKKKLLDQYSVQVFYRRNGSIGWRFICSETKEKVNALSHYMSPD